MPSPPFLAAHTPGLHFCLPQAVSNKLSHSIFTLTYLFFSSRYHVQPELSPLQEEGLYFLDFYLVSIPACECFFYFKKLECVLLRQ